MQALEDFYFLSPDFDGDVAIALRGEKTDLLLELTQAQAYKLAERLLAQAKKAVA